MPPRLLLPIRCLLPMLLMFFVLSPSPRAMAQDATLQTASYLLSNAITVQKRGQHNTLLRALRQLHDPELTPLFGYLADSSSPSLKIHGFLGLAETQSQPQLDLPRLANVKEPMLQAEIISAAMDNDLVPLDQCKQLLVWPDLSLTAKLLLAMPLIQAQQLEEKSLLEKAAGQTDQPAQQALAALAMMQLDMPDASQWMSKVQQSTHAKRDDAIELAMQTAIRFEFEKSGPWAMQVAQNETLPRHLRLLGLRAAMRFQVAGSLEYWQKQYEASSNDPAQQSRLAFVALGLAQWLKPELFEPMVKQSDPLMKQIGLTGQAIAAQKEMLAAVSQLVALQHAIANNWLLGYAKKYACETDAVEMGLCILQNFNGPDRNRAQRFDDAIAATQVMIERHPTLAKEKLKAILADPKTPPLLTQAILVGLIRCSAPKPDETIEGMPLMLSPELNALVWLLKAKNGQSFDDASMKELALIVRGGGELPDPMRLQAAWNYLQRTNQSQAALNQLIRHP